MASTGPLDRGIASTLSAGLNPMLSSVRGTAVQVGRPVLLEYPDGVDVVVVDRLPTEMIARGELTTVVFVAELCQPRWTGDALQRLVDSLGSDGRLLFVEPVAGLGMGRLVQRATTRISQKKWGYSFNRDIPAELRATGITLTSVDRLFVEPLPTVFTYAAGDARFYDHA